MAQDSVEIFYIREAVLKYRKKTGMNWADLCRKLGWIDNKGSTEVSRIQKTLGLAPDGKNGFHASMRKHTALKIIEAIDMDPVDFGI